MMKNNRYPKSLVEVWGWKEKVYEEIKYTPNKTEFLREKTNDIIKKLGLKRVTKVGLISGITVKHSIK